MARHKQHQHPSKERNLQLTDFAGLREVVIAHHALLRSRQATGEGQSEESDQSLHTYFAG